MLNHSICATHLSEVTRCDGCSELHHIDKMDAKPALFNSFWWNWIPSSWAFGLLGWAADKGFDFDTLLCRDCYGSGYEILGGGHDA